MSYTIHSVSEILKEIQKGHIRIPEGPHVLWSPRKWGDLLDSLYKGYPIGSIVVQSPGPEIPTLDEFAGVKIERNDGRILLDGYHRLYILMSTLGGCLPGVTSLSGEEWSFDVETCRFTQEFGKSSLVPLGVVVDRILLNRFMHDTKMNDDWYRRVENLQYTMLGSQIPVYTMPTTMEDLEAYWRINS